LLASSDPATCQVVEAPAGGGMRLVPDTDGRSAAKTDGEGEIRLTYRELTSLIEDAIRSLR
jgi:hypothetical protein